MGAITRDQERYVKMARQLADTRAWVARLAADRVLGPWQAQAEEQVRFMDEALSDSADGMLLARVGLLEAVAVSAHKLDSEDGLPRLLRETADTIEGIRRRLDASGYDEWYMLDGIEKY